MLSKKCPKGMIKSELSQKTLSLCKYNKSVFLIIKWIDSLKGNSLKGSTSQGFNMLICIGTLEQTPLGCSLSPSASETLFAKNTD